MQELHVVSTYNNKQAPKSLHVYTCR